MSQFAVPGYDVVEMIGFGGSADVWLGRDRATGEAVALKRLRATREPGTADRLRREAAALAVVSHPHVVRLRAVLDTEDDIVLVLDHAAGGSLATLLASRGRLSAGEVVTLAVALAQALSAISAHGLVHGDISPGNILFSRSGRPLLSDFGVVQIMGITRDFVEATAEFLDPEVLAGATPTAASDVYALGAVCLAALRGAESVGGRGDQEEFRGTGSTTQLVDVLRSATASDPGRRPTATALAAAVFDTCTALPIRWVVPADDESARSSQVTHRVEPVPRPGDAVPDVPARRWRRSTIGRCTAAGLAAGGRSLAGAMSLVAVIVAASILGMVWARSDAAPPPASVQAGDTGAPVSPKDDTPSRRSVATPNKSGSPSWASVLRDLDAARSRAFARADATALERVYARGAPALGRDRRLLAGLVATGTSAHGLRLDIQSVQPVRVTRDRALLKVVDVMSAYKLVSHETSVTHRRGRSAATWMVTLVREKDNWRVFDIRRA